MLYYLFEDGDFLKKIKSFLSIVFALLILSSCAEKQNALLDLEKEITQSENFSFETECTEYSNDVKTISYTVTNTCDEQLGFSTYEFELQYKTNNGWKEVAFKKDTSFFSLATILNPSETIKDEIQLDEYYYLPLTPGEYRIVKDSFVSNVFKIN